MRGFADPQTAARVVPKIMRILSRESANLNWERIGVGIYETLKPLPVQIDQQALI